MIYGDHKIWPRRPAQTLIFHLWWLRGTAVERRSLAGELFLCCERPVADGWPLMWVNRRLTNQANSAFHLFGVDRWVVSCNWISPISVSGGAIWWTLTKERQVWCFAGNNNKLRLLQLQSNRAIIQYQQSPRRAGNNSRHTEQHYVQN